VGRFRIIPVLLFSKGGLVKTVQFKNPKYVGDPINAIKIFNDKEVDELVLLDIDATKNKTGPNYHLVNEVSKECFMPFSYGGGISTTDEIKKILNSGAEKVVINSSSLSHIDVVKEASYRFGSQSIVICLDIKKNWLGKYYVYTHKGEKNTKLSPVEFAIKMQQAGAGELFLQFIDKDGSYEGYDLEIINQVSSAVDIPVVACGGAGKLEDFSSAMKNGASAVAAGSLFVFYGPLKSVLINYPSKEELIDLFRKNER
jgi:imidazole glycerol-phosphate synthase subunit HisF